MNWDQVEGKWKEMTGNIKAKWGDLTDDELTEVAGNREALEGKIQSKYGKSKEQAKDEVDQFLNDH
ncbi:CsbD family protein [Yoonia sp. MH D7]